MPKGVEHMISDLIGRGDHFRVESLMPKGVEHKYLPSSLTILACVESLMPKGVEHVLVIEYFSFAAKCWISDAERRWAQVETAIKAHLIVVLNLWCRKALSTQFCESTQAIL